MSNLLSMWEAYPVAGLGISTALVLGAWFLICRAVEYHAVRRELRRALAPLHRPKEKGVLKILATSQRVWNGSLAVYSIVERMGDTRERRYVYEQAVRSLFVTSVTDILLTPIMTYQTRASGIRRIAAMFWWGLR